MESPLPPDNKPAPERPNGAFQSYFNLSLPFLPPSSDPTPNTNPNPNPNPNLNPNVIKPQNIITPLRLFGNKKAITSFKEGLLFFDKKNRCKVLFQATAKPDIGKNKTRNNSAEDSPLNITDSFQYRAEPLIDENDLVLDTTQDKNLAKKVEELDLVLGLWLGAKKRNSTHLVKSKPKMRRKSDTSLWSGGVSALERKTFFWTYEYVAKPVQSVRPSVRKDTENSSKQKTDTSPRSAAKKSTQSRLKQWSKMALEMTKEGKDEIPFDKESPYLTVKNQKDTILLGSNIALENGTGAQEFGKIKIWGSSKNSVGSQDDDLELEKSKSCAVSPVLKSRSPKHIKLGGDHLYFNRNTSIMAKEPLQFSDFQKKKIVLEVQEGAKPLKPKRTNSNSSFTIKQSSSLKNSFVGDKSGHYSINKGHRRELSSELMNSKDETIMPNSNEESQFRGMSMSEKKKPHSKSRSLSKKMDKSKVLLRLKETLINKVYNHNTNTFVLPNTVKKEEKRLYVKSPPPRNYVANYAALSPQMRLPRLNPDQGPVIHGSVKGHLEKSRVKSVLNGTLKGKMSVPNLLMSPGAKINLMNISRTDKNSGKLDQSRLNMSEIKDNF